YHSEGRNWASAYSRTVAGLGAYIRAPHREQKAAPCWVSLPHWGHLIAPPQATASGTVSAGAIMMMPGASRQLKPRRRRRMEKTRTAHLSWRRGGPRRGRK